MRVCKRRNTNRLKIVFLSAQNPQPSGKCKLKLSRDFIFPKLEQLGYRNKNSISGNKCGHECAERRKRIHCWWTYILVQPWCKSCVFFKTLNIYLPQDSSVTLQGLFQRTLFLSAEILTHPCCICLIHNCQEMETASMSEISHIYNEMLSTPKKN